MPRRLTRVAISLCIAACGLADKARANPNQLAYGRHLSQECTTCHRRDGTDSGIPSIVGWQPEDFIATMKFYQSGARSNPAMVSVATLLGEEQLAALAAYFATLQPPQKKGVPPPKKK